MTTPADAVSRYFSLLQAGEWAAAVQAIRPADAELCRARILARTFRMRQVWHDYSGGIGLVMKPVPPEDDLGPDPTLVERWKDFPVEVMNVSTAGELVHLSTPILLERLLALHRCDEIGNRFLPWGGKRVEILKVKQTTEDAARVSYAYLDQSPDDFDPETLRLFQRPWQVDVYRAGSEWLLDVPYETMGSIPIF